MKLKVSSKLIFLALICLLIAIISMIIPYGVIMIWGAPPGETNRITYHSYFDLTPFGYGHFFPLITAVITVIATIFTLLHLFLDKLRSIALVLTLIATISSVFALLLPPNITVISVIIAVLLIATTTLQLTHIHYDK